nr:immunoglobulin light chain junction region [Macaca mulatta]MOW66779.1 immunoglobulin light chain junction region [Macaca mulatta]MOW69351.1 immunoglobulin light chain junction region [Macaca mulatta]MOW70135.1 immunoglobulin light chain junction region [Macaca mulatta]MOW70229.1 immunoglobulin light chain junction region [Macaca mulatta]
VYYCSSYAGGNTVLF